MNGQQREEIGKYVAYERVQVSFELKNKTFLNAECHVGKYLTNESGIYSHLYLGQCQHERIEFPFHTKESRIEREKDKN